MRFLSILWHCFLDFLFPKRKEVLALESFSTEKLYASLPRAAALDDRNTVALFDYAHPLVKEIVWEVKYNGNKTLADKLGELIYDVIVEELNERNVLEKFGSATFIPMPISGKRRFERGWNQAELICEAVKRRDTGKILRYLPGQLAKIRHTERQTTAASRSERKHNLKDTMLVMHPAALARKYVVLVDDVVTTGSTFAEAKRALKEAGVRKTLCVAIAH